MCASHELPSTESWALASVTSDPPVWIRRANGGVAYVGGGMHACNARPLASLLRLAPLLLFVVVFRGQVG